MNRTNLTVKVNAPSGRCSAYAKREGADVCVYQYDSIAGHYVRAWDLSPGQLRYVIGKTLKKPGGRNAYLITSPAGPVMGVYVGKTPAEAVAALNAEASDKSAVKDWIIQPIEKSDAAEVMTALDAAGFESHQNWDEGYTDWTLDFGVCVRVSGSQVEVL
jgi:hypothetical protein